MTKTLAIRIPQDVVERVETYRARLTDQNPAGIELTVSDVARVLLLRGLDAVEAEVAATKRPRR